MPRVISWSPQMDDRLRAMQANGDYFDDIAMALGVSKNAVINRCTKLKLPARTAKPIAVTAEEARSDDPLPKGHPLTWGAISNDMPWPENDHHV